MIQGFLPDDLQRINMLFSMIKPGILYGGNQKRQKYLITNQFPGRSGTIARTFLRTSYQGKNFMWLIVSAEPMKIPGSSVRFILEVAWQAHFVKNMFIRPEPEELEDFKPDFVVLNASKATNPDWQKQGLNSENFIFFNLY